MPNTMDDALNRLLGKRSCYTMEEIRAAERKKRRSGGNLLQTLEEMTGRSLPDLSDFSSLAPPLDDAAQDAERELDALCREVTQQLDAMESAPPSPDAPPVVGCEGFDGLAEELGEEIFGQAEFLRRLVIAFKRPFVLPPQQGLAKNSIYLTGAVGTGRHSALRALAERMAQRRLIGCAAVRFFDLSRYRAPGDEELFLQDLYAALHGEEEIICFEQFESCHAACLTMLDQLFQTGRCPLGARYTLQNGQLVRISHALAAKTVDSLSAAGKYLVLLSSQPLSRLADRFGASFPDALGDVCETAPLSHEAMLAIARREQEELGELAQKQLSFLLTLPEELPLAALSQTPCSAAAIVDFYDGLLRALAEVRLERSLPQRLSVPLTVREGTVFADFGTGEVALTVTRERYRGDLDAVRAELDEVVGLREVKDYVLQLEQYYAVQQLRRSRGLRTDAVSRHMIFTGNPGTGKTTIARIISRYLKAIGVLSGGQLVEVSRADLVGRYVGHTAPLTNHVLQSALGGVLFIDEAYSLCRGRDDSFGLEAIDTLVKGIEDHRDDLIVILAGYEREMQEFLESNSGLRSRFPNLIHFPDYTGEELVEIAHRIARSKGYTVAPECDELLRRDFDIVQAQHAADAGNGRLARNRVEDAILNQSRRLIAEPEAELSLLLPCDFATGTGEE